MAHPHPLTVGVDETPASRPATLWAADEAVRRDAPLRLVHVQPPTSPAGPAAPDPPRDPSLARLAHDLTDRDPRLRLETVLVPGEPREVLRELSRDAALLVIGSRGLGPLRGFLVGSVALPTVAHAQCPVVLVRAEAAAGAPSPGETGRTEPTGPTEPTGAPRGVTVGVDIRTPCEGVLRFAFEEARRRSAPLRVRHGWNPPPVYGARPFPLGATALEDVLATRADALSALLHPWYAAYPDVTVDARAVLTPPAALLVEAAADAALLVLGRPHHRPRLGPLAHAALNHAPAPVAVVPHT